jgi:lysyl-tRNA synthetase class 2
MHLQGVLEVFTPALSQAAATDPHVLSIRTSAGRFLHTSPEFPMKRLLAAHALDVSNAGYQETQPDLYQIATVFRAEESGRFHNTEFTLLEWYRVAMDHVGLMADLEALLQHVWLSFDTPWPGMQTRHYGEEVRRLLGVWPENVNTDTIAAYFAAADRSYPAAIANDVDAALDLFMDEFVLPEFAVNSFTLLIDYPVSQSALARLGKDVNGRDVAQRFELYFGQVELANGFHELSDAQTQRARFEADLLKRAGMGVAPVPLDENLLAALQAGLPDCAGLALGLERLHMILGQHKHISEVLSFDDQRA